MRKCLLQMILWIIIAVIHSPCAYADAPLTIVVDAYNPPNMYLKDGKASGLYPLLLSTIFERMNENVVIDAVPWKRVLDMVNQGVAGAGGVYKTDDRLVVYDFSAPVYNELLLVFVRRGNAFKFETVSDLNGKHVGIILGWSYGAAFDKAKEAGLFSVDTVNRDHLNFKSWQKDGWIVSSHQGKVGFLKLPRTIITTSLLWRRRYLSVLHMSFSQSMPTRSICSRDLMKL